MFTISPIFIGAYLENIIQQFIAGKFIPRWQLIYIYWPLCLAVVFYLIGTVWRIYNSNRDNRLDRVYFGLRWFYDDLGLDKNNEADIRCTLWTPLNSKVEPEKMKIVQLVNYYPRYGKEQDYFNEYRINKHRGRVRKVAKKDQQKIKPIGIVGNCIFASLKNHNALIIIDNLDGKEDFQEYMITAWNYSKASAKRLTQDRRSYMCITLMESGETDILGVIFMDARTPNTFTERTIEMVQPYLPRIAEALTA
jgi:hypothetical protein